jgi:putative SOS response-associated peptidase YedK
MNGKLVAAAGLWGHWSRVRQRRERRIDSFAVFTVKNVQERWQPLILLEFDWNSWLEGTLDLENAARVPPPMITGIHAVLSN